MVVGWRIGFRFFEGVDEVNCGFVIWGIDFAE